MTAPEQPTEQDIEPAPARPKRAGRKSTPESPLDPEAIARLLASSGKMTVEHRQETEEELASRLRIDEANAEADRQEKKAAADADRQEKKAAMDHRRRVEITSLIAYLVIAAIVCIACLWVLRDKTIAPQDKAWVSPTLALILGGVAGFMTGRLPGRSSEK
jgi:hypothetical protein